MRFLFTLLSVLALSSPLVHATSDTMISEEPFHVGLHASHSHHAKFKVMDVAVDPSDPGSELATNDVPPPQPIVEETAVVRQNEFNPIGSHDVVIEYKSTDDSIKPPWTVSVDQANDLFHYACWTGSEDSETWTPAMGDVINLDLVRTFFAEYDTYTHPRQIPRVKCTWNGSKIRAQVHLRHLGQRSGDILCTSSGIVDMAKDMARVAGCVV